MLPQRIETGTQLVWELMPPNQLPGFHEEIGTLDVNGEAWSLSRCITGRTLYLFTPHRQSIDGSSVTRSATYAMALPLQALANAVVAATVLEASK